MTEPEGATGTKSLIYNHEFVAEEWWDTCAACGLSMAAHAYADAGVLAALEAELKPKGEQ